MTELQQQSMDLDGQHVLTPIWIKGRIRPIAVFIEAKGPLATANIKHRLLAGITKDHMVFSPSESPIDFLHDKEWSEKRMKLIEVLLQMPKSRPSEGEGLQSTIKPLKDLLDDLEGIQTDLSQRWNESIDPYAHLYPTSEQKQKVLANQNQVQDKRKKMVETHRFAAAFGILLSQESSLSLTAAVNIQLEKLEQKPLSKKMVANYVRFIRQKAATAEGQNMLLSLLGATFPIAKLLAKSRLKP
jgi:hypothetical protein